MRILWIWSRCKWLCKYGVRYTNINPVNHYIKAINKESKAILVSNKPSSTERMEEEMFLGCV